MSPMHTRTMITLAIAVVIGVPTAFYAAKNTGTFRARTSVPKAASLDLQVLECKKVARDTKKRTDCYALADTFCRGKRGAEKKTCDLRVRSEKQEDEATGKLIECGALSGAQRRRCAKKFWKDLGKDMVMTSTQRDRACNVLTDTDRDRCLMQAVFQGLESGQKDRSLCAKIANEELRITCQEE